MEVPEELHSRYLERRQKDLHRCYEILQNRNFGELEKLGHQLKGNAQTFGHQDLSLIGSHLEAAAALEDLDELGKALGEFSQWVNQHLN